jgi:hypothetical protein
MSNRVTAQIDLDDTEDAVLHVDGGHERAAAQGPRPDRRGSGPSAAEVTGGLGASP